MTSAGPSFAPGGSCISPSTSNATVSALPPTAPSLKNKHGMFGRMKKLTLQSLQIVSGGSHEDEYSHINNGSVEEKHRPKRSSSKVGTKNKTPKVPTTPIDLTTPRRKAGAPRTIGTATELLNTVFYEVNLLRQRWTPVTRDNFLDQLMECQENLEQALNVNSSLVQEMRCRWRTQYHREFERMQTCWNNYCEWLQQLQEELNSNKEYINPDCIGRGRWLAELLEDACKEYLCKEPSSKHSMTQLPNNETFERRKSSTPQKSPPFELSLPLSSRSPLRSASTASNLGSSKSSLSSKSSFWDYSGHGFLQKIHPHLTHEDHALLEGLKRLEEDSLKTPPPKPPISVIGSPQNLALCKQLEKYQTEAILEPPCYPPPPIPHRLSLIHQDDAFSSEQFEDSRSRAFSTPIDMSRQRAQQFVKSLQSNGYPQEKEENNSELHFRTSFSPTSSNYSVNHLPPDSASITSKVVGEAGLPNTAADIDNFFKDEDIQEEVAAALTCRAPDPATITPYQPTDMTSFSYTDTSDGTVYHTTEVKSDTEDCEEIIEVNGKKYRQKYERRVVLTRHRYRHIIEAPAGVQLGLHLIDDGSNCDNVVVVSNTQHDEDPPSSANTESISPASSEPVVMRSNAQMPFSLPLSPTESSMETPPCPEKPFFPLDAMEYTGSLCSSPMWLRQTMADASPSSSDQNSAIVYRSSQMDPAEMQQQLNVVSKRLSSQLFDLFRTQWHKTENMISPHERSKTISYIQRYTQQAPSGQTLHRTMCVQQTRTVRMRVRGEDGTITMPPENSQLSESLPLSIALSKSKLLSPNSNHNNDTFPGGVESGSTTSATSSNEALPVVQHRCLSRSVFNKSSGRGSSDTSITTPSSSVPSIFLAGEQMVEDKEDHLSPHRRGSVGVAISEGIPTSSSEDSIMENIRLSPSERREFMLREFNYIRSRGVWSFVLEQLDATPFIFMQKTEANGKTPCATSASVVSGGGSIKAPNEPALTLTIKAAPVDALLVYGTTLGKQPDDFFLFFETFMTTFKMFIPVEDAIDKLMGRYLFFRLADWSLGDKPPLCQLSKLEDMEREKLCTTVVSFFINMVAQIRRDLTPQMAERIAHFRHCLLIEGQQKLANVLHRMLQEQIEERNRYQSRLSSLLTSTHSKSQIASISHLCGGLSINNSTSLSSSINSIGSVFSSVKPLAQQAITVKPRSLLDFSARALAEQLTLIGAEKFEWIDMEDVFHSSMGAMVRPLCDHHNTIVSWTRTLLYSADLELHERKKYFHHLFEMARELFELHNFNAYIAMVLGLNDAPDCIKPKKLRQKIQERVSELLPMSSRSPIYAEQMSVSPPAILYMGLISNLLAYLETNSSKEQPHPNCPELGNTISFWRYWRHFVIINFFYRKRMEVKNSYYQVSINEEIRNFFNNFSDVMDDATLNALKLQLVNSPTS